MPPIYEYKCKECGNRFEHERNDVKAYCCDNLIVRVYSPVGLRFNGPGFHKNDYGSKK